MTRLLVVGLLTVVEGCAGQRGAPSSLNSGDITSRGISYEGARALSSLVFDCNADGIGDGTEIDEGVFTDSNNNGIPDICESDVLLLYDRPEAHLLAATKEQDGRILVRYTLLQGEAQYAVRILDKSGEVVVTLAEGQVTPGDYRVSWDQRDQADGKVGRRYIVQLRVDGRNTAVIY